MRALPKAYVDAAKAKHQEVYLSVITTVKGRYLYSEGFPTDSIRNAFGSVDFWNGVDATLGDGGTWGAIPVIEFGARLLAPGTTKNTIAPQENRLLISLAQTERGSLTSEYDNSDGYFSTLLGDQRDDPFIAQIHELYHGFVGMSGSDFIKIFQGEIHSLTLTSDSFMIVTEGQSVVYPQTDTEEGLTAYALQSSKQPAGTVLLVHSAASGSTTFTDAGPTGHTLTRNGAIAYSTTQAGKFNNFAIEFDGTDDYISIGDHADFKPGTGDFYIGFFAYITAVQTNRSFITQDDGTSFKWSSYYGFAAAHVRKAAFDGNTDTVTSEVVPTGQWVHIGIVMNSGVLKIYFDGVEKSSANISKDYNAAGTIYIGWMTAQIEVGTDPFFDGWLDEIIFVKGTFDSAELPPTSQYGSAAVPVFARDTFTHAALAAVFFASDDWTCNINFTKDDLSDAGVLFSLENDGTETTIEIGVDASNFAYITTGQDVEGTPATTTYTDTTVLTATMIAGNLNLFISYSDTDSEITFRVNGYSATQAAAVPYDRAGTNDEQVTIGDDWGGKVLNVKFNTTFFATNNEGDDGLAAIPDVIGGHDLTLVDANWEAW